ncbi:MAG: diaminopimelate epimerase [Lachnospiraceae bacterium]
MKFTKMHGTGNDYVYVNCFEERVDHPSELAVSVSDRHFGVGGDGLILIKPSDVADFQMDMYNADGSRGMMCGNGIRCVGKYVYDHGMTDQREIRIETLAGIKELSLNVADGTVQSVRVNMGSPLLQPKDIPVLADGSQVIDEPIEILGSVYRMTCVGMGNPHAVVYVDDVDGLDLEKIGPHFEHHPLFPDRVNTEFVRCLDKNTLQMRVWERGSGETWACGTGACATVVASALNGYTESRATVRLRGGELEIDWDRERNCVYMTGPATTVFEGELF